MPPTLIELDGFGHRVGATAQGASGFIGTYDSVARPAGILFDTGVLRLSGLHLASLNVVENGAAATNVGRNIAAGRRQIVVSFYFRVTTAPAASSAMFSLPGPTNPALMQMDTTGHLGVQVTGGTAQTTSGTYADSAWHLVDMLIDTSGTTYTIDWKVDGVAQTQATRAGQTAADMTSYRIGSATAAHNLTFWVSDFILSATSGDYAIGHHFVLPVLTSGNGTHSLGSTNPIVASTGSDMEAMVDDWDGSTPSTTDYITYTSTTTGDAATDFAEITLVDPDSGHAVWDAIGYIAGFAAGTNADNADTQVLTAHAGSVIDHIGNLIDYSGSTTVLGYYRQVLARPSGGWTNAKLAAAVVQWGFSTDTNPQPRLSAVMLEFAGIEDRSGAATMSGVTSTAATGTKKTSGAAATSAATSTAATGKKGGKGASAVSTTTATAATGKKGGKGTATVTALATGTAGTGQKGAKGTAAVSGTTGTTATGSAGASVSVVTATAATGTKATGGAAAASTATAAAATARKSTGGAAAVTGATSATAGGSRGAFGVATVPALATAIAGTGFKGANGTADTGAVITVTAFGVQSGAATITAATSTAATGTKHGAALVVLAIVAGAAADGGRFHETLEWPLGQTAPWPQHAAPDWELAAVGGAWPLPEDDG